MDSTPPVDGKKTGRPRRSGGISPTDCKVYSRRARKPRTWEGFETDTVYESQVEKREPANKSVDECQVKEIENKIIDINSKEHLSKQQETPVKKKLDDICTSIKGKRRSRKVNKGNVGVTNIKVELESDIVNVEKTNNAQPQSAVEGKVKKRKIVQVSQSIEDKKNDMNERLTASAEEMEKLRVAVESKRTSKFIEKCDRVIERLVSGNQHAAGNSVNEICVKTEPAAAESLNRSDFKTDTSIGEIEKAAAQKKTPGRKKGRPRKSIIEVNTMVVEDNKPDSDKSGEIEHSTEDVRINPDNESAHLLSTPVSAPVRKRGRRKALEEGETPQANTPEEGFVTPNSGNKRRSRKKKSIGMESDDTKSDLNVSQGSSRRGRKRKELNYAALDDLDLNGESEVDDTRKRHAIKMEGITDEMEEDFKDNYDDSPYIYKASSRKTPATKGKSYKCNHCEYEGKGISDIRRHYAVHHQLWWTEENQEGSFHKSDWPKVFKLKKFLNCTKCDKQINFATYYLNHWEWCGREHLTYTCEHCHKGNLVLRWQQLHLKTCPALVAQMHKERKKKEKEERIKLEEEDEGLETPGKGRQRKAAKKAMSMVQNISKEMDPSAQSDISDDDPDVVIHDDEEEDDDDEDNDEDIFEEESIGTPDEDEDDLADDDDDDDDSMSPFWFRANDFNPHPLMEEMVRDNWSQELFIDWLPRKQDWTQLSQQESEPYLPRKDTSIRFCFHKNESPATLETLQSTEVDGSPLFYTGLTVWQLAWCPTTFRCSDNQFLAVTGKTDHSQAFLTDERLAVRGLVQIWDTGIHSNKLETKAVPRLCYNMVHDFGHAVQMVWCPSGCYRTNDDQADKDSHTRLGLLAVSFTDGTCRIFSLPLLPVTTDGAAPTYRAKPVLTLIPYHRYEQDNYTCSSVDWTKSQGHTKVIVGYSKGSVRLFNLVSKSPFQRLTTNNEEMLLPYMSFQPHGNLVRSALFCSTLESVIVTSSEDFEMTFWDLNNLGSPLHCDGGSYMPIRMFSSLWQHGVFVASDENYAYMTNKGRYIDSGHLLYFGQPIHRKDERGAYYISSQPACIWDIQCSDWVGHVASCDNRGVIFGLPMRDFLTMSPDCKTYKYRQILLKTHIREDTVTEEEATNEITCGLNQSELCKKCSCIQSNGSLDNDDSKDDKSKTSVKCTCYVTDHTSSKANLSMEEQTDDKLVKVETVSSDSRKEGSHESPSYQTLVNNSVLQFEENFKVPKYMPHDKDSDRYDRPSIAAIKSLNYNPNHLQCCWLAYGGNSGLVRLVNVQKLLSRITQNDLRDKKQI